MTTKANQLADRRALAAEQQRRPPNALVRYEALWRPLVLPQALPMRAGALDYRSLPSLTSDGLRSWSVCPAKG